MVYGIWCITAKDPADLGLSPRRCDPCVCAVFGTPIDPPQTLGPPTGHGQDFQDGASDL